MRVRTNLLGLAGLILLISGCSTCETCQQSNSGYATVPNSACESTGSCKLPGKYLLGGRYRPVIDTCLTKQAARNCALKSLNQQMPLHSPRNTDFCDGFVQAFVDLSLGSRGVIPAIPPPKYWTANNRSADGHCKADQWFAGYREGVSQASYKQSPEQTIVPTSIRQQYGTANSVQNYSPINYSPVEDSPVEDYHEAELIHPVSGHFYQ
ncbi:MAG: hypothetical protein QM501_09660 [Gimesia sp.]